MTSQCFFAILVAASLSACASLNKELNQQHLSMADAQVGSAVYQGSGAFSHLDWRVGQWAKMAMRHKDVWSIQTVSLVGEDDGSFWLEAETIDPKNKQSPSRIKMQIKGYEPGNPKSVQNLSIGTVYTQNGDEQPMMAPPFVGPMTGGWVLANFKIDVQGAPSETATSPAGTFNKAQKLRFTAKYGPFKVDADHWLHSAVPIWGIVKSLSNDGKDETRLLAFGLEGAESKLDHSKALSPMGF